MNRTEFKNKILKISNQLIADKGFVCPIDILCELDYLNEAQIKDWRFGKIQYLEKVCGKNLGTLSFIHKTIKEISKSRLIFSKTRDENIENAYATHYIDTERIKKRKSQLIAMAHM